MRLVYWRDLIKGDVSAEVPAFFRDSMVQTVARNYFFTRENFDGSRTQSWAQGGWIAYRSGLIADMFGIGGSLHTSLRLQGLPDEGGSRLLTPEQDNINVLAQAYARVRLGDQELRGGRTLVDSILLNPQDNRMVPNTFEGLMLASMADKNRNYDYAVGYAWTIKPRDSNDFIAMSDALAGSRDARDRGATFGMVKYRPLSGLSTAFSDYYIRDFVNTGFAQVEYDFQVPQGAPQWSIGANYADQRSVGANLLTGSSFETHQAAAKVQVAYAGWIVFAAVSATGRGANLLSPFGLPQNYTDMQQISFDSAGEKAFGASLGYDFTPAFGNIGLTGLSVGAWYTQGWDAINPVT